MITGDHDHPSPEPGFLQRHWIVAALFGAFILYYLVVEHRAHLFAALPWLILLACPLMHVFMHGGHGGHDRHSAPRDHLDTPEHGGRP